MIVQAGDDEGRAGRRADRLKDSFHIVPVGCAGRGQAQLVDAGARTCCRHARTDLARRHGHQRDAAAARDEVGGTAGLGEVAAAAGGGETGVLRGVAGDQYARTAEIAGVVVGQGQHVEAERAQAAQDVGARGMQEQPLASRCARRAKAYGRLQVGHGNVAATYLGDHFGEAWIGLAAEVVRDQRLPGEGEGQLAGFGRARGGAQQQRCHRHGGEQPPALQIARLDHDAPARSRPDRASYPRRPSRLQAYSPTCAFHTKMAWTHYRLR